MAGWFDSHSPRFALRAALAYAFFAGLWITGSDFLVELASDVFGLHIQLYKGLLFVAVTAVLLYFLLRQLERNRGMVPADETGEFPGKVRRKLGPAAPLAIFAGLAVLIAAAGYAVYAHERTIFRQHKEHELVAVAELKVNSIASWLAERRGDADTVRRDLLLADTVQAWLQAGKPSGIQRRQLSERLAGYWLAYGYRTVILLDQEGRPLLGAGDAPDKVAPHEQALAHRAMHRNEVQMSDFHFSDGQDSSAAELDVMAPLTTSGGQGVGVVYFRLDPSRVLYPLLRSWPTPSDTAEALLVRREGDEVEFLSELKKLPGSSLRLHLPMSRRDLPAVRAAEGHEGVVEGVDYHNDPVFAVVRTVPNSPWFLVVKVDRKEVFTELNNLAWAVAALTLAFVGVTGLIIHLWWRRQWDGFLLREFQLEKERRQLASRIEALSRHVNDAIFLVADDLRILDFNERAEALYGYRREELLSMNVDQLRASETRSSLGEDWRRGEGPDSNCIFETLHQRKDGSVFPVEINLRLIEHDGQRLHLGVVRDITERRAAQASVAHIQADGAGR